MNVLVCGSRKRGSCTHVHNTLNYLAQWFPLDTAIVQGGAKCVDYFAKTWAIKNGYCNIQVDANWNYFNSTAGPIRNGWMLKHLKIDLVVAFDGDNGTKDMIRKAKAEGVAIYEG